MRDTHAWRTHLQRSITAYKDTFGPLDHPAEFLDTELALSCLYHHFPTTNPWTAWWLTSGYPFPALVTLPDPARRALALVRLRLPAGIGKDTWKRRLTTYQNAPAPYRLYQCNVRGIELAATALLPERQQAYEEALRNPPPLVTRLPRFADTGRHRFTTRHVGHEVDIPHTALRASSLTPAPLTLTGNAIRPPQTITFDNLLETAEWMEQHTVSHSFSKPWVQLISEIHMQLAQATGLTFVDQFTLDGLLHLIGMVASGKSTLFTVLTVLLVRRGLSIIVVQPDVATILRELATLATFSHADPRMAAVPLIGRTNRADHVNRLHVALAQSESEQLASEHPAFPYLSTVCPLDGLRQDNRPLRLGEEPCTRLIKISSDSDDDLQERSDEYRDCPFLPVCPEHLSSQRLGEARIWLATPSSLLSSTPQAALVGWRASYAELAMRNRDVALIDEADLMQIQFDERFAPMEVLVGKGDSFLDRLARQVPAQIYRPGRPFLGRSRDFDRWLGSHDNTQRAVNLFVAHLRENIDLRRWFDTGFFTGRSLLRLLAQDLSSDGYDSQPILVVMEALEQLPLDFRRSGQPHPLASIADIALSTADRTTLVASAMEWLNQHIVGFASQSMSPVTVKADHLTLAVLADVMDRALQTIIYEWPVASEYLELDRGRGGLFYRLHDDLVRLVPDAPMGTQIGFQYHDPTNSGDGELRFFHIRGVGRSLLYHLHDALQASDGQAGPHVILASGTSWAPGSPRYHLHTTPGLVLSPNRRDEAAATTCFYEPVDDPEHAGKYLAISGIDAPDARIHHLRLMIQALCRPLGFSASRLQHELDLLPSHRQRILLIVGSYDEAAAVGEALARHIEVPDGAERVLALVPDRDDEPSWKGMRGKLRRSLLESLADQRRDVQFLVAPLQAIERGHNILVAMPQNAEEKEAAIGSVYFLVRPYPRPGDVHTVIQQMNAWSLDIMENTTDAIDTAAERIRAEAMRRWHTGLHHSPAYHELGPQERTALLWTQLVMIWQTIGRLLRGGAAARVHFIDMKWAEKSAFGEADTEISSMLVGFQRILREALLHPDPLQRAIAQTLYGAAAAAFAHIQGVRIEGDVE